MNQSCKLILIAALSLPAFSTAMAEDVINVHINNETGKQGTRERAVNFVDSDKDGVALKDDHCLQTELFAIVDENGCSAEDEKNDEQYILNVEFANDSVMIPLKFYAEIEELANIIKSKGINQAIVEGHTDSNGSAAYNESLSYRRALSVVNVLTDKYGVEKTKLIAKGYGESDPIDSNYTEEGRRHNRRVVVNFFTDPERAMHPSRLSY